MKNNLPKFEGQQPKASGLRITGRSGERVGALANEEEVFLVVKGVVAKVGHGNVGNVFTRTHDVKVTTAILVDRDAGARFLDEATAWANERFGIRDLFNQDGEHE